MSNTLWRELLYERLAEHSLSGEVLDVGGARASGYHKRMGMTRARLMLANLSKEKEEDIACDLENGIPAEDCIFDTVLCINVLEHIFNYAQLLREMHRVLRPQGTLILAVPFIIEYHPSPRDHWRYSGDTLLRIVGEAGFSDVQVETIGTGVFGALYQLGHGMLHFSALRIIAKRSAVLLDALVSRLRKRNVYDAEHYPLGFVVTARRSS